MAQNTTGSISGYVNDEDGFEVPGTEITIMSADLIGGAQTRTADESGFYRFVQLPPGSNYKIRAEKAGMRPVTVEGIVVRIGGDARVDIVLKAGTVEEVVVKDEQIVDTEKVSVGNVLTKEFLQKVPTGRSYQEAVQLSAGVTGGANPNMAGGASNENTFTVDGATVTDPVTGTFSLNFNFDAIQQIEVLLGGYDAEYGEALGGIINIVTDSGTNNLQFDTSVYYTNGDWRPRMDARYSADGYQLGPTGFDSTSQLLQVAARVSGPLVQDKAWFIFTYQHSRSLSALSGIPQRRDFDGHYLFAKLTVQPNSSHRLSLLFQADPTTIDNLSQGSPFQKAESQPRQFQSGFLLQGRWQWFINQDMNLDTRVNVQKTALEVTSVPCTNDREADVHQCIPGEEEGSIDYETPGRVGLFGAFDSVNYGRYTFDDRWRFSGSIKYSLIGAEDPLGGRHDVKVGVETNQFLNDVVAGLSGNAQYYDANVSGFDPETFTNYYWVEVGGPIIQRSSGATWAAFVQDVYKPVSNVTIRAGLRLDNTTLRNDLGEPTVQGTALAPRFGISWDPFNDQKTKIAGGYFRTNETGRQAVAQFTSVNAFGTKLFLGELFNDNAGAGFLNSQELLYSQGRRDTTNSVSESLTLPSVDEINLTLQRQLWQDWSILANFQGRFTRSLYAADEQNLIYDEDGSAIIGSFRADPQNSYLRLRTPRWSERNYYALKVELAKRASKRWGGQLTYQYTWIDGTQNASLGGSFRNDPQTQYVYGRLTTATEHQVRGFGFVDLPGTDPWTTTLALTVQYDSGVPLERIYWGDAGGGGYSVRVRDRGFYWQFNDQWQLGFRIQQAIDVRKGKFMLDLQIINFTNNRAPDALSSLFYNENRLFALSRQTPLSIQLGARYQF